MLLKKKRKKRHSPLTREYLKSIGIDITPEQYSSLAELDIVSGGQYTAFEFLRLLQILKLI